MPYKDPQKLKEYRRAKYLKDREDPEYVEKKTRQWKEYSKKNKERIRLKAQKYNASHREEHKLYAQKNRERIKERQHTVKGKLISLLTDIKKRCYNPNSKSYHNYGGRGIGICEEWLNDSESFYAWALNNGYQIGLTIDRIDVNGNYCPENCRFVSRLEQSNNKRNTIYYECATLRMTFHQWADYLGFDYQEKAKYFANKARIKTDKEERIQYKRSLIQAFIEDEYNRLNLNRPLIDDNSDNRVII